MKTNLSHNTPESAAPKVARLQVIEGGRNRVRGVNATAMNQHIKHSIIRMLCDSPLEFKRLDNLARYAGTSEGKAIAVIQEYIADLRSIAGTPNPPATNLRPSWGSRRAA